MLSEHGGEGGARDQGLFESALHRPQHLADYGEHDVAMPIQHQLS